jgi:outer membrane receptor for ferrienterochelin and colicins
MKKYFLATIAMLFCAAVYAQNTYNAIIKDEETKEPLIGVTVQIGNTALGGTTSVTGEIKIDNIPNGTHAVIISYLGYETRIDTLTFPLTITRPLEIFLHENHNEMEEVVISSTRSSRNVQDIPTRVEFIGGEELAEKANMKPGDIRVVLSESTGIQTQQTSATSANASIRIQGLDGRYTQLLKDGFPLYSGAASGLGLLQIPPLDLKQIEIIKGSSSTLYGGGAIAGMVNLISKTPQKERELSFLLNGTSAGGFDASGFYSERFNKTGTTVFVAHNQQAAYDPSKIDLSAIPKYNRLTINPRFFYYPSQKTTMSLGINATTENRVGGDMHYIKGEADSLHSYFEKNNTQRVSSQFLLESKLAENKMLTVKNSVSYFKRKLSLPNYLFDGEQYATFSEVNYSKQGDKIDWVVGGNVWTDAFAETKPDSINKRNYNQTTAGLFLLNTWKASEKLHLESGVRLDYVIDYGAVVLPRVSLLYKYSSTLSTRIGGGLGYKTPTIFTEESERIQYRNVGPISPQNHQLEKSYGSNWDINYKTAIINNKVSVNINHLFFYTRLNNPLAMLLQPNNRYEFKNISGYTETMGTETNVKFTFKNYKWFVGYTFTDTRIHENGISRVNPLTAKHRINSVLMYEVHDKWRIGVEGYYFSQQLLSDGTKGNAYTMFGFMAERIWKKFALYVNFENFTDVRQTKFGSIYQGSVTNPTFKEIYAPLDGFVINGGVKFKL